MVRKAMEVGEFKEETLGVSSKTEGRSRSLICPAQERENIWLCQSSHCASMGYPHRASLTLCTFRAWAWATPLPDYSGSFSPLGCRDVSSPGASGIRAVSLSLRAGARKKMHGRGGDPVLSANVTCGMLYAIGYVIHLFHQ